MENEKNEQVEQKEPELRGWEKVTITPDMPLSVIVNFMNVLNQRLCQLERLVTIQVDGQTINLTTYYELVEQAQAQNQADAKGE